MSFYGLLGKILVIELADFERHEETEMRFFTYLIRSED